MGSEISEQRRAEVARRAGYRCEYCLIHENDVGFRHQIDHIVSRKHGGTSDLDNLAYACVLCNRQKGSDIASIDATTGDAIRLFHPRHDLWSNHFRLDGGIVEPLTAAGIATVRLLRMNTTESVAERRLLQILGSYPRQVR